MKITVTIEMDASIGNLIYDNKKVKFTNEIEERILIEELLKNPLKILRHANEIKILSFDKDISNKKHYRYSFDKFIECHPNLKNDKTFKSDCIECNSWHTRFDGFEVFPACDEQGKCFALIDEVGTIYKFNNEWCEEFE